MDKIVDGFIRADRQFIQLLNALLFRDFPSCSDGLLPTLRFFALRFFLPCGLWIFDRLFKAPQPAAHFQLGKPVANGLGDVLRGINRSVDPLHSLFRA